MQALSLSRAQVINAVLRQVILLSLLSLLPNIVLGQTSSTDSTTPTGMAPGTPAGSFALSDFDTISPFSGKLNFRLPLLKVGGRGKAGYTITQQIEQNWSVQRTPNGSSYTPEYASYNWWSLLPGYGPGLMQVRDSAQTLIDCQAQVGTNMVHYSQSQTRLTFTSPDGTEYEFIDALNYGAVLTDDRCNPYVNYNRRGKVWVTHDGAAATFIADNEVYDNQGTTNGGGLMGQTGGILLSGMMILRDGTKYRIDNMKVSWIRDTNGNKVTFTYDTYGKVILVQDSLNRQVSFSYGNPDTITYKGFGGATRQIKVWHNTLDQLLRADYSLPLKTASQLFPNLDGSSTAFNQYLVSQIDLPDGRSYQFKYNYYGELARVVLPTGGAYEYDYAGGPGATTEGTTWYYDTQLGWLQNIYRRVTERRVYKENNNLEGKMVFTAAHPNYSDARPWYTNVKVEEKDASNNLLAAVKHYYYGSPTGSMVKYPFDFTEWDEGKEYQTEALASDSTTALRRTNMTWQQRGAGPVGLYTHWFLPVPGANDPRMVESTTTLTDVTPNLVSKQTHIDPSNSSVIGYDQYNNPTDTWEYDFGQGAPGSFIRRTQTAYLTSGYDTVVGGLNTPDSNATVHIRSLPTAQRIYSDTAGTVKKAETTYEYDNYAAVTNHAGLVNRTSVTGFDTSFSTGYLMRGNVTAVSQWRNTDNASLSTYAQYDILGNVVKAIDANGNATTFDFSDRFGSPNGEAELNMPNGEGTFTTAPSVWLGGLTTFAFPTKVTNALGHTAYTQFDYFNAKPVDTEDPNNVKSSLYYNDALERPTQGVAAVGTTVQRQTLIRYNDSSSVNVTTGDPARSATTISDKDTYLESNIGNGLKATALYDGLGRTWRKTSFEGGGNWTITDTEFDALGRVKRISNPYRSTSLTGGLITPGEWTVSDYDVLGRVIKVTTPDSAHVDSAYSGNQVLVTDQASKQRMSQTDALGRLLKVWEIRTADTATGTVGVSFQTQSLNGYLTNYAYDTLNNLTTVTQQIGTSGTTQTRTFAYDSLKRLTSATNPESGTTYYQFDNNGNLTYKVDALNRQITYYYDALNRSQGYISNQSSTPQVVNVYDTLTNGKGRLGYSYTSSYWFGCTTWKYLTFNTLTGYDALGRLQGEQQYYRDAADTTWGTAYATARTYDLAGNVKSQTYPSGRVVNYSYNTAGQMSSFSGNLGDGTTRNYATNLTYTPAGRLTQEQFGQSVSGMTLLYHNLHYNNRQQLYDVRLGSNADGMGTEWTWNRGALRLFYDSNFAYGNGGTNNNGNVYRVDSYVPTNDAATTYAMSLDYYGYDALNRITGVWENKQSDTLGETSTGLTQQYLYDRFGNRRVDNTPSNFPNVFNSPFNVDQTNNQLLAPNSTISYDAVGNQTNDGYTGAGSRTYDANNRLVSAAAGGGGTVSYTYNANGSRVTKTVGSTTTWYIYGLGGELVAEYPANGATSTPQIEYGYRNGELLIEGGCDAVRWRVTDHLGSTRMSVGTTGSLASVKRTDYLPFGEEIGANVGIRTTGQGYSQTDCWRQKFTGYERDTETGLDYALARMYANRQGRFTSVDPLLSSSRMITPQSWNKYSYTLNNPLKIVDPTGLDGEDANEDEINTIQFKSLGQVNILGQSVSIYVATGQTKEYEQNVMKNVTVAAELLNTLDMLGELSQEDVDTIQNVKIIADPGKNISQQTLFRAEGLPGLSPKEITYPGYTQASGVWVEAAMGSERPKYKPAQIAEDNILASLIAHEGKHGQNWKRKENGWEPGRKYEEGGGASGHSADERAADAYGLSIYRRLSGSTEAHPDAYDRFVQSDINATLPHQPPRIPK